MKILLDMNLSPLWVDALAEEGFEAMHWSAIGRADAQDTEIFDWARQNHAIILTHDLDFGTMLAMTRVSRPSVIQVRTQDIMPSSMGSSVIAAIKKYEELLDQGALIVVDKARARIRILPL